MYRVYIIFNGSSRFSFVAKICHMGFFNGFRTAHSGVIVIVFVDKFVEDIERLLTFFFKWNYIYFIALVDIT